MPENALVPEHIDLFNINNTHNAENTNTYAYYNAAHTKLFLSSSQAPILWPGVLRLQPAIAHPTQSS